MNLSIPRRFLIITASFYIISFLFFLVLNSFQFAPKDVDLYFKTSWVLNNSLLNFFEYLIPVQSAAIIYTFSVFYPKTKTDSGLELLTVKSLNRFVTIVIIILLCLTAVFFVGNEIFKPRIHNRLDAYSYLTKTSRAYYEQAEEAAADGRLFDAEKAVQRYLAIKPDDKEGVELYRTISARIENQYSASSLPDEEEGIGDIDTLELSYEDALKLARRYLEIEDYYSAYYYAQIAAGLSGNSDEPDSIRSQAWTALSRTAPSREDTEEFRLFSEKKRGTDLLLGDSPIEAYYLFNQLNIENPTDPDVSKYLEESIKATRKLTYFINEAEDTLNFPGITDIAFLNKNTEDERELIFFGKMVTAASGTYFEDIEAIRFNERNVISHLTAQYGKLIGDHIVLNGIDRENKNIRIYPEYIVTDKIPEIYNTLKLNIDWGLLHGLSSTGSLYKKMNLIELIEFEPVIAGYGWMVEPLYIEIITRILNPCGFIILSLLMIALSWNYRKFAGKVPVGGFVLLPAVLYIVTLFTQTYIYGMRLLCSWIFLSFGRTLTLTLLILSQVVLLIIVFLFIAGIKPERNR